MIKGSHHNEATRGRISETLKEALKGKLTGKNNPFYGRRHSQESLIKMREAKAGVNNPMYGKPGSMLGKQHTIKTKRKISEKLKGVFKGDKNGMYCMTGDKNPAWIDGRSYLPYSVDFNNELKESIKKRDGYMCQFPDCATVVDLTIHHIDYDKMNSNPLNLITLCRNHNTKTNSNREYWKRIFNKVN